MYKWPSGEREGETIKPHRTVLVLLKTDKSGPGSIEKQLSSLFLFLRNLFAFKKDENSQIASFLQQGTSSGLNNHKEAISIRKDGLDVSHLKPFFSNPSRTRSFRGIMLKKGMF